MPKHAKTSVFYAFFRSTVVMNNDLLMQKKAKAIELNDF